MSQFPEESPLTLRALLAASETELIDVPEDVEITDIAYDSRAVRPGTLFVALATVGGARDSGGHRFLSTAVERGAAAVVVQDGLVPAGIPHARVADSRRALGELAAEFFHHPSRELMLYAVTGTDGKTTTCYLLEGLLASAGCTTGLLGTVETKLGPQRLPNDDRMTTPESLDVQRLLRRMRDVGVTHAAMEASSHALALDRLRGCEPAACAVTSITADHIEFHGSWESYFAAKALLFTEIGEGRPAVLNRDDPPFERLAAAVRGPLLTYGFGENADLRATSLVTVPGGTQFQLQFAGETAETAVALPGRYNVANALAAAGLALCTGFSLTEVATGLRAANAPPGRLQRIDVPLPFEILVDYAHTVNAFQAVLAAVRERLRGDAHLLVVFGAAGNRDRGKRPVLAQIARQYADYFFVTNEDPFDEEAERIIAEIADGVPPEEEGVRYERVLNRGEAIERALDAARPGDTVIILGKGHEQSIVTGGVKQQWNDADAVRRGASARR